jgi:hypothetical protein
MRISNIVVKARKLVLLNYNLIRAEIRSGNEDRRNIQDYSFLPSQVMDESQSAFVLSTGRCGTMLLARLLRTHPKIDSYHEATPKLVFPAKIAYELWKKGEAETCELAILSARYELVRDSFLRCKMYVETNNRLTFFAPQLAVAFERSKFIHLVRHPGAFVRSAIRRGYYARRGLWSEGRIVPLDKELKWEQMSEIEKNGWLWNETNLFAERFKEDMPNDRVITIKSEDLYSNAQTIDKICDFLGMAPLSKGRVEAILRRPINAQRSGAFPKYSDWTQDQKEQLREYAALAKEYGYNL